MTRPALIFALFMASTAGPAFAQETYKCKTPGGMVYQDRPCAGVRYATEAPATTSAAKLPAESKPVAAPASDIERAKVYIAMREKERRVGDLKEQIARQEESIAQSQQARDAENYTLRERKSYANNNLAGANLEQALATEMQAVNSRYAIDIGVKQEKLRRLREDLAKAQKE